MALFRETLRTEYLKTILRSTRPVENIKMILNKNHVEIYLIKQNVLRKFNFHS